MANANSSINLNIKTKVDSAELNKLKQQLQEIRNLAMDVDFTSGLSSKEIQSMTAAAHNLEKALEAAFDPDLNTVNIQKFNQYLNKTGLNINDLQADLALAGITGQQAFVNATTSLLKMGTAVKQTSVFVQKMADSMANTIRWSITSGIINTITGTIQKAVYYIEDLDSGLNDIRIVTGKSADEMERFAESANNAAKALAVSTEDYTEGALIYYQQGLDDETVKTLTDITAMTSNVTGQGMRTVSEQLTAVWNGYQVANQAAKEGMGVYQEYVDKMAAVGAATASDLEELATAMSKVASAANAMGVDFDQLSAQIATIVSVTRQAPESVGTALKTIYARIGDLKIDGVDEFGVTLGEISSQLEQVGIQVMDQSGNLREVGPIMEEVASKWNTWNEAQQQSIAIAIAGKRQYNNLLALFENWDMYTDTLNTAANAAGTLNEQQEIALESLSNKLEKLSATAEDLYDSLIDEEGFKDLVDVIIPIIQFLADAVDAVGNLNTLLPMLGSIGAQVFSKQIASGINRMRDNLILSQKEILNEKQALIELQTLFSKIDFVTASGDTASAVNNGVKDLVKYYQELAPLKQYMNEQELESYQNILNSKNEVANLNIKLEETVENWKNFTRMNFTSEVFKNGEFNYEKLAEGVRVYEQAANNFKSSLEMVGNSSNGIKNKLSDFFNTIGQDINISTIATVDFKKKLFDIIDTATNSQGNIDNGTLGRINKLISNFPGKSKEIIRLRNQIELLGDGSIEAGAKLKASLEFKQQISQVTRIVGVLGQLGSTIRMIQNMGSIWSNDSLTESEKMLQSFINLTSVLGSTVGILTSLSNILGISAIITQRKTVATLKLVGTEQALKEAEEKLIALENASLLKSPVKLAIIAAITIAVIALTAAYGKYKNKLAENTKEAKKEFEAQKELIDFTKEQKDAVDNLAKSYESLAAQYENNELTLEELRNKTYALCLEYNQQDLALKTLIADYEQLNSLIKEAQIKESTELKEQAENGKTLAKDVIKNSITEKSGFGIVDNFGNTVDVYTGGESIEKYTQLKNTLEKYGMTVDKNGKVNTEDFTNAIANNYDEIYKELNDIDTGSARKILELMTSQKENVEKYQELNNQAVSAQKDILSYQYGGSATSLSEYRQKKSSMAQLESGGLSLFDSEYDANKWAESQLIKDDANAQFAIDNAIAEAYAEKNELTIEENLNKIEAEIAKFNNSEKGFIYLYLDAAMAEDSLEDFVKEYDTYAESLTKKQTATTAKSFIGSEKILTEGELDTLYAEGSDFGNTIDRDSFSRLSAGSQQFYLVQYYSEYQKYLAENKEEIIEETQALQQSLQESIDVIEDNADFKKFSENEDLKTYLKDTSYTMEDLNAAAKVVANEGMEGLTESQKELVDGLKEKGLVTNNDLEVTGKLLNKYDDYQQQLESATSAMIAAAKAEGDWVGALKEVEKAQDANSKLIDDLQSGYKALSSVVKDYNKTGTFTLDNYQTLLNLSPEMLSALEFEGGQLSINKERVKELAKMRIEEAKALIIEQTQTGLQAIMEGKAAEAGIVLAETNIALATSTGQATEAAVKGAEAWLKYAKSMMVGIEWDSSKDKDAIAFLENQRKLLLSLDKINLDGKNFEYTMGASDISSKDKKELEDEIDRYWELNKALEAVTETISDLDKLQSHLHGKELINSLKQENELLEEQANRYKAINAEQMREADELRQDLSNYGVTFGLNGEITNYAEAASQMVNWYNNNLDNETADKNYEKFKKLLERYETLYYEEMIDIQNQLDDIYYEQLENNLKAWETDLKINLELKESEREWSDFIKDMEDDFKAVYKNLDRNFENMTQHLSSYKEEGGTIDTDIKAIQDVINEIEKINSGENSSMFASISEAQEKLKELQDNLMEDTESVHKLWVDAWDTYIEGIEQSADKFDDLIEKFNDIEEELEYQRQITELLYGEQAYNIYDNIYKAQIKNSTEQLKSLKEQSVLWENLYNQAEEGSEEQLKYYELMKEAQETLNDKTIEHIKLLKEERNNLIDETIDLLNKSLTGGLGIDKMKEQWEDAKWFADRYFDSTERLYELELITNKYNKALADTSSLESQQKLKELMDGQLADLEAKEKLSEYDIALAEKRLTIAQAEIALQNAQNTKNSMKLVRNASGNWEYQYVSDEEDIANKKQQLLESYQDLYDYVKKTEQQSLESIVNMTDQFYRELTELKEKLGDDSEAFAAAAQELYNRYYDPDYGKISILMGEHAKYERDLNIATGEVLFGIYENNEKSYENMTNNQKALIDDFKDKSIKDYFELQSYINNSYDNIKEHLKVVTSENITTWNTAAKTMVDTWAADNGDSVRNKVLNAMEDIEDAIVSYEKQVDSTADVVGKDFSEEGIKGAIDEATNATKELEDATLELCENTYSQLLEYKNIVKEIEEGWRDVYDATKDALEMAKEAAAFESNTGSYSNSFNNNDIPDDKKEEDKKDKNKDKNNNIKNKKNITVSNIPQGNVLLETVEVTEGQFSIKNALTKTEKDKKIYPYHYSIDIDNDGKEDYFIDENTKNILSSFDTGGYTGDWVGGDGRLAMLHEKELVLNKTDTKNILDTVNTIRDLGSVTSSIGSAIVNTIKNMVMDVMGIKAGGTYSKQQTETSVNNTYEIYAEFPNANDVTSIREAILSLPNLASQYTSQNKK